MKSHIISLFLVFFYNFQFTVTDSYDEDDFIIGQNLQHIFQYLPASEKSHLPESEFVVAPAGYNLNAYI